MLLGSGSSPAKAQSGGHSFLEDKAAGSRDIRKLFCNWLFVHCSFIHLPDANKEESDTIAPRGIQLKSRLVFILNSTGAGCWKVLSGTQETQHTAGTQTNHP